MRPLVSLILPVYNVEQYLEKCLMSVRHQTYQNIEILVVDDGSQDGSFEIAQKHAYLDTRIKLISHENRGLGSARNSGIQYATGDFVVFVDTDDWIEPNMIEQLISSCIDDNVDLVRCGFNMIREDKILKYPLLSDNTLMISRHIQSCLQELTPNVPKISTTAWACMFRTSIIKSNNINFTLKHYEDTPFFIHFTYFARKIVLVPDTLYNYVFRTGSITQSNVTSEKIADFYRAERYIYKLLESKSLLDQYKKLFQYFHLKRIILYAGVRAIHELSKSDENDQMIDFVIKGLKTQRYFLLKSFTNDLSIYQIALTKILLETLRQYEQDVDLGRQYLTSKSLTLVRLLNKF